MRDAFLRMGRLLKTRVTPAFAGMTMLKPGALFSDLLVLGGEPPLARVIRRPIGHVLIGQVRGQVAFGRQCERCDGERGASDDCSSPMAILH